MKHEQRRDAGFGQFHPGRMQLAFKKIIDKKGFSMNFADSYKLFLAIVAADLGEKSGPVASALPILKTGERKART